MSLRAPAIAAACALGAFLLPGCDRNAPGKPGPSQKWVLPTEIRDPKKLFTRNCLGCHGDGAGVSASIAMNDPLYLALAPRDAMRKVIAEGIPGTAMPPFAEHHGGMITEEQIDLLMDGIFKWQTRQPDPSLPPHAAPLGDAVAGAASFGMFCASCHGADGAGIPGKTAGSVVDPAYLGLVTDQYLRTVTIIGRRDLGMPDYTGYVSGRVMTNQEIADIVAWLSSHRAKPAPAPIGVAEN